MSAQKPTIILISGAWHTTYHIAPCIPAFQALHYNIIGHPLLAAGRKASTEETINDIVQTIEQELEHRHEVYLILHSAAGLLGTAALNQLGKAHLYRLREVFYLGSVLDWSMLLAHLDTINSYKAIDDEDATVAIDGASTFFNDADESVAKDFEQHLVPQWNNNPQVEGQQYKKIAKTYIHCLKDMVIPFELSQKTAKDFDMKFETFDAAHSCFSTKPVDFANFIDELVQKGSR